ncbi:MAG: hypothetical protein AAFY88_14000, partial [Acidobacteriota bacterium]
MSTHPTLPRRTPSPRRHPVFYALVALLLGLAASAAQGQDLRLSNGLEEVSSLSIGDDLFVHLPMLVPTADMELFLLDELRRTVSVQAPVEAS